MQWSPRQHNDKYHLHRWPHSYSNSTRSLIKRDPSTSDTKFDAPKALERAFRLSNDLSSNEILNFVDKSVLIRVIFWYLPFGTLFSTFAGGSRDRSMVCPLGPVNTCIFPVRGENCWNCLGFCNAIGDEIASKRSRLTLPPWRWLIVDSSVNCLLIISIIRYWNVSSILLNRVKVTSGTGCAEPEEHIWLASISSESRTNYLVSSV